MRVAIIDYGLGNLRSVAGAVRKVGHEPVMTGIADEIARCDKLILPGVGAFGDGMSNLSERGLVDALGVLVNGNKMPLLAICLGFQLLAQESDEFGHHAGLGWINARVKKLDSGREYLRIPHVGWNDLLMSGDSILWDGIPDDVLAYYVHSYHVVCDDERIVIGRCFYGSEFVAAIEQGNIYATQFHPEKSQYFGLAIIKNFIEKA